MRIIKLFFISVIVLFLVLTAISSLLPSKVRISRAIDIDVPATQVMAQLEKFDEWEHWNKYVGNMKNIHVYPDKITSEQLTIILVKKDSVQLSTDWLQGNGKSFKGVFNAIAHDSTTTLQWYFDFHFKWYPWEKFSSIVYDAQLGGPMQESLLRLKEIVQNVH